MPIFDAKNQRAVDWYGRYGAVPLEARPLTLVLPLATFLSELWSADRDFSRFGGLRVRNPLVEPKAKNEA